MLGQARFGDPQLPDKLKDGADHELLHPPREEPWGQTVARLKSPEGAVIGISYAPVLHDQG